MESPNPEERGDAPEIAEVGVIARAEAERRKRGMIRVVIGLVVVGLLVAGLVMLSARGELGPQIDVEEGEQSALEETNDPQCRALIADVTAYGERFRSAESRQVEPVLASEIPRVEAARARVGELRQELERLRLDSLKANLRYEESKKDLADFFKYVDTELRLIDLRGERQLARLEAEARGETYEEPQVKKKGKIIGKKEGEAQERTPEQKRDDSILAIADAFNTFRVWHTSAMHPCGAADPGETPWTPPAGEAAPAAAPAAK